MKFLVLQLILWVLTGCHSLSTVQPSLAEIKTLPIKIHGHRGSRGTHPENTLKAFEEALLTGVDFLELDLVLSADGVPIVTHDPIISFELCLDQNLKPLTRRIPIGDLKVSEIKAFQCGSVPHPLYPDQQQGAPTSLLTLDEFLKWFAIQKAPGVRINLETKMQVPQGAKKPSPKRFVDAIIKRLRKYKMTDRTVLQSFDFRTLKEVRKREPQFKISMLFEKQASFCQQAKALRAEMISPEFSLISKKEIELCHKMGVEVHPWTLNEQAQWEQAIEWKVDGIITDYPRKLKIFIQKNYS